MYMTYDEWKTTEPIDPEDDFYPIEDDLEAEIVVECEEHDRAASKYVCDSCLDRLDRVNQARGW